MKLNINTKRLKALNPCQDRLDNWLKFYKHFTGDIVEFLDLPNITDEDKIWVAVRVLPISLVEVFAIDCSFMASDYTYNAAEAASSSSSYYDYGYAASHAAEAVSHYVDFHGAFSAYVTAYYSYRASCTADYSNGVSCVGSLTNERQRQIESLIYLIQNHKKGD